MIGWATESRPWQTGSRPSSLPWRTPSTTTAWPGGWPPARLPCAIPSSALALARKAVALTPGEALYLNTLGVALYRAGQYIEAIATLEKSLAASKGESDAFDLFFLAMARYKLGQVAQARAEFDRAIQWRREHTKSAQTGWNEDLDAFQAEGQALLNGQTSDLPANVFVP